MFDILTLLQCLLPEIKVTTMRQLNSFIMAMLAMSGRVTMLGIYRDFNRRFSRTKDNCYLFYIVVIEYV